MDNNNRADNLKEKLTILGASDKELDLLTDKFINENVNQVVVVDDIFYNKSNNFDNFEYRGENKIILKTKKLSNKKSNKYILEHEDKIVTSDDSGNIIVFSLNDNKIISKFNFYKKTKI